MKGSFAYVAQRSWIQQKTLRDNILFKKSFDATRYSNAMRMSALEPDLLSLPQGDLTEIGEKVCYWWVIGLTLNL